MAETQRFDYSNPYVPADMLRALHGVESSFSKDMGPSPKGALGPFQFQEATGREYGLQSPEDRLSFEKSKVAAGKYLAKLYNEFGNWEEAFRAYNAGPTGYRQIKSGVKKSPENEAYFQKIRTLLERPGQTPLSSRGVLMAGAQAGKLSDKQDGSDVIAKDATASETPARPTRSLQDILSLGTQLYNVTEPEREQIAALRQQIAKTTGDIAQRELELEQQQKRGVVQFQEQEKAARNAATAEFEQAKKDQPIPAFVPTRDNAEDLAKLFSFIGVMGTLLGKGGGKQSAMGAMAAMTGMMEGWQKGRMDLYNQEKVKFEKDFAQVNKIHDELYKKMKDAVELASKDKALAQAKLEEAIALSGSDILKMKLQLQGPQETLKVLQDSIKGRNEAINTAIQLFEKDRAADAREKSLETRQRQVEANIELRLQQIDLQKQRLDIAIKKAEEKKEGKPLPDKQTRELEGLQSISNGLEQLAKEFKPEYASMGLAGFGSDISFEYKRRLGDKKAQDAISWWSRYERLQAPNRHALFGATLTGNERQSYLQYTAKKSDSAETVLTMLRDQISYSRDLAESKIMTAEGAGYKVPKIESKDYFGTYGTTTISPEPAKTEGQAKPTPTQADIDFAKNNPQFKQKFIDRFGREP